MTINKQALLDNGWELGPDGLLTKFVRDGLQLWASHDHRVIFLESLVGVGMSYELYHVKTMEDIAALMYLLMPWLVMDTAPIDTAIRARFAEGGGE